MSYGPPVYSLNNVGATTPNGGNIIDIGDINLPLTPPVMIVSITNTATCQLQGSHDGVNFVDFSGGGLTASGAKDLIVGIRFWRASVTAWSSGTVTAVVGAVPCQGGRIIMPHLITVDNNPTQNN